MSSKSILLKLFTDSSDYTSISGAVRQVQLNYPEIEFVTDSKLKLEEDEIAIFQISSLDSEHFNYIIENADNIQNKLIFVLPESDAVLVSTLAKLGFTEIFVLPYELFKFINYLKELIDNRAYITSSSQLDIFEEPGKGFSLFLGNSVETKKLISIAKKLAARDDINILITGETGTGKGLIAKAIHQHGKSKDSSFVEIMCTSIPESLLESELFGYEAGAFTNARTRKHGLFELADNGTIFLDEIGDLNPAIQMKLLRTIEKKVIRRLGGTIDIPFQAKIISATSRNLTEMVEEGTFRKDLFHRLYVVSLDIPPLRERKEDILLLADHFMRQYNKQFSKKFESMEAELRNFLVDYPWYGNVRELKNAIERSVLLGEGKKLRLSQFSFLFHQEQGGKISPSSPLTNLQLEVNYRSTDLRLLNKIYAADVLKKEGGNKSKTAKILGISRPKLDSLLN